MSEQVQLRRDIAANLATFTGAQGELLYEIDQQRLIPQDGATAGGFPIAKLSELTAEAQARAAADSAEATSRQQGDATNAQAIQGNMSAIVAEVARAEAAEAGLSAVVAGKANASDLAGNTQFANALYPPERPGDGFGYFTSTLGPLVTSAGGFPGIATATIQVVAEGSAYNIPGNGYLLSREFYPIEPARAYNARVALSVTQPGMGQAIVFGFFEYNAFKQLIGMSPIAVASFSGLQPASGRQLGQSAVTRTLPVPTGNIGVDPSTRYVRLVVQNTDPYQYVGVEVMQWVDVTDSTLFAPSVASLQAQITQLASQLNSLTSNYYVTGRTAVNDANYTASAANNGVGMLTMTSSRVITLPPLNTMALFVPFPVADEGGHASPTQTITIQPAGSDTINGLTAANGGTLVIESPYQTIAPRAGASTWIFA